MVVRLRKGPSGPLAESVSGGDPLPTARWVDPETLLDPADQNGSESAPFSTITAALASLEADAAEFNFSAGAIYLAPADYGGEAVAWVTSTLSNLTIVGLGTVQNFASFSMTSFFAEDSSSLKFLNVGSNEAPGPAVTSSNPLIIVTAESSILSGITGDAILLATSSLIGGPITGRSLEASGSSFAGSITVEGICSLQHCWTNSSAIITADRIQMQSCSWNGDLTAVGEVQLRNSHTVSGFPGGTSNIQASVVGISNSRLSGNVTADFLTIDTVSYQAARTLGFVFTITNPITIVDLPITASIAVAVPTVAAGGLGYADQTLVGTPLEDVFNAANEPVIVSPETDLAPAGPSGGGFLNARLSAANTLRCAFVGPISSATANFTVTRGR